jgi:hypothetical protein
MSKIDDIPLFIAWLFAVPMGFILSVRILVELLKWIYEGFKKGYDV